MRLAFQPIAFGNTPPKPPAQPTSPPQPSIPPAQKTTPSAPAATPVTAKPANPDDDLFEVTQRPDVGGGCSG